MLLRILPQGPVSQGNRGGMFSSVAIVNFLLCVFCTSLLLGENDGDYSDFMPCLDVNYLLWA